MSFDGGSGVGDDDASTCEIPMKSSTTDRSSPQQPDSCVETSCSAKDAASSRKTRKSRRSTIDKKSSKATLTSSEFDERSSAHLPLQVASCANPAMPSKTASKRLSKPPRQTNFTALQADGEKIGRHVADVTNKRRTGRPVKPSESQVSVASTKSSQSSVTSGLLLPAPISSFPPRGGVTGYSDASINNRTLRWENALEDSDDEANRLKQYKINRRKRYLAAANKKYSDWLKTLEYEHKRPPSNYGDSKTAAKGASGSSKRLASGREIIVPSLIAKVTQLHSNSNANHNHSPAILNYS